MSNALHNKSKLSFCVWSWYENMSKLLNFESSIPLLTLNSHPEALHWQVKSSGVRQSEITKVSVLAGLGEELNNGYKCVQIKYKKTAWYGA